MVLFENTQLAFKQQKTSVLKKKSAFLKKLTNPKKLKRLETVGKFAVVSDLPIKWFTNPSLVRFFCGGEGYDECENKILTNRENNIKTSPVNLIERSEQVEEMRVGIEEILMNINKASRDTDVPFVVFNLGLFTNNKILVKASQKAFLTQNEKNEAENFIKRVNIVCNYAYQHNVKLLMEAEDSIYQTFLDDISLEMMRRYNKKSTIVYTTLQFYRPDRLNYLFDLYSKAIEEEFILGVKLVRGGFLEKEKSESVFFGNPIPLYDSKEKTDLDFDAAVAFCIENVELVHCFIATQNNNSLQLASAQITEKQISTSDPRVYFGFYHGIAQQKANLLAAAGYNVVNYLPYGKIDKIVRYYIQQVEENPSFLAQLNEDLGSIEDEKLRRRNS